MAEFPFQFFVKRTLSNGRAGLFTPRGLKKHLRTSKRCLSVKSGEYLAEFDRDFCDGAEPRDLIEQIETLMDAGQILKKGDVSYVSRVTWNNKDVVVKRYDHKGFIHSLRHTIKKSRARKGWLFAHLLGELNIATPKAMAYIEQRRGLLVWESYLVTEYVEGQNLRHFLRVNEVTGQQKLDRIEQVVNLLDKLWNYSITHGDLKHLNVLITENGVVLTDLDGMIVHKWALPYRHKRAKDIKCFLKKKKVSPAMASYCQLFLSNKMAAFGKLLDDFNKMRMDNWVINIHKSFPKNDIRDLISVTDSYAEGRDKFIRVPSSDYTRVFKFNVSFDGTDRGFYLKKYLRRSTLEFVKHLFRPSRARRAFDATLMLHKNGFDAPAVIGLFERRPGPFCTDNLLLTGEVENARSMPQLLTDICQNSGRDAFVSKRALIEAFAGTIGQMHARGVFHGDLRLGNVLVVREESEWRFFFIDNERTKKFHHLPSRLRLKNLVQVNMFRHGITDTDRMRFFKAYLKENPAIAENRRVWATRILKKTDLRLRRKHNKALEKQV